ncbi:MAG: tryptophan 2,3-dioxygenase [Nonomuraea sp.]|nr:tryptophan 2,3-dioxygenase [Nonomuraea sp.]
MATPYDEYVGTTALHSLQHPLTDAPEEPAFLVTTQVMELYFGLLRTEWLLAMRQLDRDELVDATATLRRSVRHFEALNAAWASLSWMTPDQFNRFRPALGKASGFQSAMYRQVERLLASKDPSLYASVLGLLARRGLPTSDEPQIEAAWVEVYRGHDAGLRDLAEALMEVAVQFSDWRYRHVLAVRRSMGGKTGTAGSSGVRFLEESARRDVFPELWTARTHL